MARRRSYTVKEAAARLGLAESTIRCAICSGAMRAQKIGLRLNVITAEEVERYRQERWGTRGWDKRKARDYQPSRGAQWAKDYRHRKKAAMLGGTPRPASATDAVSRKP